MVKFGFHASHEQFPPEDLRDYAMLAEKAGFDAVMSSDHFHPWSEAQGQSGYVWSWLGAAMQATGLPFGTLSVPGGWRYHPAIVAQAAATLSRLFPGRLPWIAVGSGEALNEHITGDPWPAKAARNERLLEAAGIIRALWAGETVSRDGPIPTVEARLYTLPKPAPKLLAAALTPETARWAGGWADGLITVNRPVEKLDAIVAAFREGGGEGKPLCLQVHIGWGRSEEEARRLAFEQWRPNLAGGRLSEILPMPADFEAATRHASPADLDGQVLISAEAGRHREWLAEFADMGFAEIYLHNTGTNQRAFIAFFGSEVLPALRR